MDGPETKNTSSRSSIAQQLEVGLFVLLAVLLFGTLIAAYISQELSILGAAGLGLFGGMTLFFAFRFCASLAKGSFVVFESLWGGLGRGLGGWRLSASSAYLFAFLASGVLFVAVLSLELGSSPARIDDGPVPSASSVRESTGSPEDNRETTLQDETQQGDVTSPVLPQESLRQR